ncbi:MAG: Arc family DNA-binding protein [Elusimicrobiota bacterium]
MRKPKDEKTEKAYYLRLPRGLYDKLVKRSKKTRRTLANEIIVVLEDGVERPVRR